MNNHIVNIFQNFDSRTYDINLNIPHEKVNFNNRFGITIVGDLYLPEGFDEKQAYAAVIVCHPHGGVKEQGNGMYAQKMATKGFVSLAIDFSYFGESGGMSRQMSTPEGFIEDIMAAVDFIGTREYVNNEKIGLIGICGSGGFAISAASLDPRIKAVATMSMYDMGKANREGLKNSIGLEERKEILKESSEQRWKEFKGVPTTYTNTFPDSLSEEEFNQLDPVSQEFIAYYCTKRGHHYLGKGAITFNSKAALMNFSPYNNLDLLAGRPLLIVSGENSHSREFSDDAYAHAYEPKELYLLPNTSHTDLYDQKNKIPFDKLEDFFKKSLN